MRVYFYNEHTSDISYLGGILGKVGNPISYYVYCPISMNSIFVKWHVVAETKEQVSDN